MNAARHLPFPRTDGSQLFDVDNFLADLERLARQPQVPGQFYSQLLDASSLAIGAKESAYWSGKPGRLRSTYQHGHDDSVASSQVASQELDQVSRKGRPQVLPGTRTRGPVLASPVFGASEVTGVLIYELSPATPPASAEQLLELAAAVAEIAGEYELRQQVAAAAIATHQLAKIEAFILRVHSSWSVEEVARELAEEGRRLLGCDRLSVLTRSGRSWHVSAVSGVDSPSPRAVAIRSMERLVRVVAVTGDPLILGDGPNEFSPQVQQAVDDYFDGTAPRQLIITPCVLQPTEPNETPLPPSATIVLEQFHGPLPSDCLTTLRTLTNHAAAAIARAEAVRRIPFANWLVRRGRSVNSGKWTRRALLWGTLAAALCGVAATLLWVPASFEISAEGRFAPTSRMRAFAPRDSIVKRILVTHGAKVSQGQPLIELRSPDLELQIEQVEGELATTRKEIAALETARLRATLPNQKDETDIGSVAAKLSALRELTASHERQLQLLAKEASRLIVVSPIDGEVLSWKPEDYLQDRPVRRGQRLLEIGATEGDWEIELDVPDRRAGHVLTAAESTQPLQVSYIVKSDPAQRHVGEVKSIAAAAQADAEGSPTLRVEVQPENASGAQPRSGMMVAAKIHCGERSLGYVWFHEAWEAIQRHWF